MPYKSSKAQSDYLRQYRWRMGIHKSKAEWLAEKAAKRQERTEETAAKGKERFEKWKLAHQDRYRELTRNWRVKNMDKRRDDKRTRRVAKRKSLISKLMLVQRGRCAYCRSRLDDDAHLDHIMPISKSGSNAQSNFQLTCPTCNLSKSAKHPIDFARELGFLI
jgi:5-methylcytosine-specific restriction endonuclease McrA